jgi:hypothetical protein
LNQTKHHLVEVVPVSPPAASNYPEVRSESR